MKWILLQEGPLNYVWNLVLCDEEDGSLIVPFSGDTTARIDPNTVKLREVCDV